jgi:hypothetical protein
MLKTVKMVCGKIKRALLVINNFLLVFFIYWIGVSISHALWRVQAFFKKREIGETYWTDPEPRGEGLENLRRQF